MAQPLSCYLWRVSAAKSFDSLTLPPNDHSIIERAIIAFASSSCAVGLGWTT
jgi:hypothetical protein